MNAEDEKRVREIMKEEMRQATTKKAMNRSLLVAAAISFSLVMFTDEILATYFASITANMGADFVAFNKIFFGSIGSVAVMVCLFFNIMLTDVA